MLRRQKGNYWRGGSLSERRGRREAQGKHEQGWYIHIHGSVRANPLFSMLTQKSFSNNATTTIQGGPEINVKVDLVI